MQYLHQMLPQDIGSLHHRLLNRPGAGDVGVVTESAFVVLWPISKPGSFARKRIEPAGPGEEPSATSAANRSLIGWPRRFAQRLGLNSSSPGRCGRFLGRAQRFVEALKVAFVPAVFRIEAAGSPHSPGADANRSVVRFCSADILARSLFSCDRSLP